MTVLAVACAAAQGLTGFSELSLALTPFFLIVSLLLCGHYVGEERIVRLRTSAAAPRARRERPRWALPTDATVVSLLSRSPVSRRGPPRAAPLAA
jgi:hypothetical protein